MSDKVLNTPLENNEKRDTLLQNWVQRIIPFLGPEIFFRFSNFSTLWVFQVSNRNL